MARKATGLTTKWSHNIIIGDCDRETIRIDFDEMSLKQVKLLCRKTKNHFRLKGFRILRSSLKHYHAIFNRKAKSYEYNCKVMAWIAIISKNVEVKNYALMQIRKGTSTLRISHKGEKPSPRTVYYEGDQGGQIQVFLENRRIIKDIVKKIQKISDSLTNIV